jgi:hypothetical protein
MLGLDTVKFARSCDEQLDTSGKIIKDPAFATNVQKLIDTAKLKSNPDGALYYTGYAKSGTREWKILIGALPTHGRCFLSSRNRITSA